MGEEALVFLGLILLPIGLIAGMYRLMAHLTSRRGTRHGIVMNEEEVKRDRIFRDP